MLHKTINTSGIHYSGENGRYFDEPDVNITEMEMHNLYGYLESI